MDWRLRLPGALYRLAAQRAEAEGTTLQAVVMRLLERYVSSPAHEIPMVREPE